MDLIGIGRHAKTSRNDIRKNDCSNVCLLGSVHAICMD
ncbi:hypothetical protein IFM89_033940, partial [Coptis chinensis]